MPVLTDLPIVLDSDAVLRAQGADPARIRTRSPVLAELAEEALAEAMPLVQPQVLYRRVAVIGLRHERLLLEGGGVLGGTLVTEQLRGAAEVVVLLCTIGLGLENLADQAMGMDLQRALALDGVGSAAAEALGLAACEHFGRAAQAQGSKVTVPISPGMSGWPVAEGQAQLLSLLDPAEIGVRLLPSGMMVPRKSLSMAIGIGPEVASQGVPCDFCSMRDRCRYRSRQ